MALVAQEALEALTRGGADVFSPHEEFIDAEGQIGAMPRRPMGLDGQALIAARGARMAGNQLPT